MNKSNFNTVRLDSGEMHIYDFGTVKLHAYRTDDPLSDEVFLLEKADSFVVLEPPCFVDNIAALTRYLTGKTVAGMLVAYHGAGATFLPDVPKYATDNAVEYSQTGGGKALIEQFADGFGAAFDAGIHAVTNVIEDGPVTIGGISFMIHRTDEAFDVEIPEINAVYTHMLGHDCHSIVAGAEHADGIIRQLQAYSQAGYDLILTSHYTPEDLKDVQTKIDYLERLKAIAADCADGAQFKAAVQAQFPAYSGENYLDMTTGFFFG